MRVAETVLICACLAAATLASAHGGVQNAGVMARMDGMLSTQKATKVLIDMASAKRAFDPAAAQSAQDQILQDLKDVPDLFAEPHTDPKMEAKPIIWSQMDDFLKRNAAAIRAVQSLQTDTLAGLQATLPAAGASCLDCHQTYRLQTDK